jgi:oxygen-independent coproporphyrinogen-3 oxidase
MDDMVASIRREIEMRQGFFSSKSTLQSVYFGGGTPSLLSIIQLSELLETIRQIWHLDSNAEITLEANPDDLTGDYLAGLLGIGFNRLSIGVQSFRDEDNHLLHRTHGAQEAESAVKMAQDVGFDNLTIDLIYGLPNMSLDAWEHNLNRAFDLGIQHMSAYALTVENKTVLAHQVRKGLTILPPDEEFARQYRQLVAKSKQAGILQYELSNFARPGYEAKHNSSYWKGSAYLGVGPSAHSFDGQSRFWNVSNNTEYLRAIQNNSLPESGQELLSKLDSLNEYIMTGLRKCEGIDWHHIQERWGLDLRSSEPKWVESCILKGWAVEQNGFFRLTTEGMLMSDHIISGLFQ